VDVDVVIETPRGSRNKYEADHVSGRIWLDRTLFTSTQYPADYGYVEGTLADDGDPLDALVLLSEPTFPGCRIRARIVGLFCMRDEMGRDLKLLTVPSRDPRWADIQALKDLPDHVLDEIRHFFEVYKDLEPGKGTEVQGWADVEAATASLEAALLAAASISDRH
jgi:inorganic pyrophosphatase